VDRRPRAGTEGDPSPGVYADLEGLTRLQYKARGFSFLPRQPVHSVLTGRYASRVRGRGLDFEEIRRYVPGDDIRTIDWKVTARTGKPHSRVFTEERDRPQIVVVDQRLSMFFGTRVAMKSVTAVEAAALAAWRSFDLGDRVGAVVFNDSEITEVAPHRSRERVMRILQAMVEMNRSLAVDRGIEPAPEMLNRALERVVRSAGHDFLVTLVSDLSGADDETRRLLTLLSRHNDVLAGLVYDPLQVDLPEKGRMVVTEGELQVELDVGRSRERKALSEFFPGRLRELEEALRGLEIPVLPLHTAEGVAEQLRHLFGGLPRGGGRRA
jgi:uncharacterized protein (DUF58 family)